MAKYEIEFGYDIGEICQRGGCLGIIEEAPVENCACHINPPCAACTAPRNFCSKCEWQEVYDKLLENIQKIVNPIIYTSYKPRELDKTKIDWFSSPNTASSMIKEGCYPEGATYQDVLEKVDGTFGGKFEYFERGRFKFIAYTD